MFMRHGGHTARTSSHQFRPEGIWIGYLFAWLRSPRAIAGSQKTPFLSTVCPSPGCCDLATSCPPPDCWQKCLCFGGLPSLSQSTDRRVFYKAFAAARGEVSGEIDVHVDAASKILQDYAQCKVWNWGHCNSHQQPNLEMVKHILSKLRSTAPGDDGISNARLRRISNLY